MIRVLFVCHGNICRSTMAQFVFQDMVNKAGLSGNFHIDSAATSRTEFVFQDINRPDFPAISTSTPRPPAGRRSAIRLTTEQ